MNFKDLLNIHGRLDWRQLDPSSEVEGVVFDSREVAPNTVYVAIRGTLADGHDFIIQAISAGAKAIVVEQSSKIPDNFQGAVLEVLDTRLSLQVMAQNFYASPGEKMTSLAVTGTNGKTSCSYIIEYLLNSLGQNCGVIGTIDHHFGAKVWASDLTTPDPMTLQKRLSDFLKNKAKAFVIEASSHALKQARIKQPFDVCLFTNLSRDHLDYHPNMEDYFDSKALLFGESMLPENGPAFAVINGDDLYGMELEKRVVGRQVLTFGKSERNTFYFEIVSQNLDGCTFRLIGQGLRTEFQSPLVGEHNVYNVVGCLLSLYCLGYGFDEMKKSLPDFPGIPGRLQKLRSKDGCFGVVDYAHTPDALSQVLLGLKPFVTDRHKLITVFGCGGDRDQGKRPEMAKAAIQGSDIVIVTSDNPRTEDPNQILDQILRGFATSDHLLREEDRREAILKACDLANSGDVVLIAGKGHEDYQIIGNEKLDFSDIEVLKEGFAKRT
ncbi:MAG: UDP-N-acetylmuramoyl-L-alanyl-D-glutamate--2,6-diaminopimelate ligase [Pseudomonadota bacterium]